MVRRTKLNTSSVGRFVKLGGLAGRVGASVVGNQVLDLARSGPSRQLRKTENLVRNAGRIAETLGELKGAAMKVGQMLSLHEGLLPPEVAEVLRSLQREAPRVPAEVMEYEIRGSLESFDDLFAELDFEAFAAASIGQVHLGALRDGRPVAVKIQYPLIDEIVKADLQNLRRLIHMVISLVFEIDVEPIWREVRDRLLEELDYTHEAANMRRMAQLHRDVPEIVIPRVVDEATTRNVLTMELVEGIPADAACSGAYDQALRDAWAQVLFEFQLRGLLSHRFLHADPNLANFAFREDGRVVVYDFGCVKEVPADLAAGYAELLLAAVAGDKESVPAILHRLGVFKEGGVPLPADVTDEYFKILAPVLRAEPAYTFGEDVELYHRLMDIGLSNWTRATDVRFPEDAIFIDRSLGGHFGNLSKLRATGPWRDLVLRYAEPAAVTPRSRRGTPS
jgi:predicted unusual protein kinase regulating ubiquinone biosynthesis (AarF/ABC1/UbiB family)